VPLWLPKDNAAIRQARANERAAALEKMDAVQRVRDRLARAWFRLRNADRLNRLYRDVLVPRARAAASTSEDLLATGKGTLAGTLETVAVYHQFRLAAARASADHGQALADLEVAIGRPFQLEGEAAR
jgi:outer membrane protein TolC